MGAPISTKDNIEMIMDGLLEDYDSFVTSIISQLDPSRWDRVGRWDRVAQEECLGKHKLVDSSILQANTVSAPVSLEIIILLDINLHKGLSIGPKTYKSFQDPLGTGVQIAPSTLLQVLGNQITHVAKFAENIDMLPHAVGTNQNTVSPIQSNISQFSFTDNAIGNSSILVV